MRSLGRERTIDLLFETLDSNASGVLDEANLLDALARMPFDHRVKGGDRDRERLEDIAHVMILRVDADRSGSLDLAEWRSLVLRVPFE